jgi:hypothetical protein
MPTTPGLVTGGFLFVNRKAVAKKLGFGVHNIPGVKKKAK